MDNEKLNAEFESWIEKSGSYKENSKHPCKICKYGGECYCPAANWMEPEFNTLKCRETLWQTFLEVKQNEV